ncbi:hypothetical protein GLOIN_2v1496657 [Rhizophagus irregularis DAOM 181602=DAOM 197198]|uniref:Uncharacterized protein n=1 Tax=Rhizophagus irregularis (strain DAOM 181602 / DAOM 197198 / MUCL 43194) TaxID=747089 RepID=A0A2P4QY82_RHIID|nr:hypothetical protein GLOIN_2v1496657 [Rhizophagus irregularis DAOM 181602=DAOM 197198]POG82613.1 hypothetical protein GLOIN_2v1496657 [Rhizophagus irregularis DAOM 181602=DAOM 197198]GET59215.1 hypothetical protein GLOIN_2v1496657 [Rhizophagus irregularis DAOM 181602=DAOM 197198]|eukprot:XP_025189479.1 hypothetical protein GLOIN_2v1496657 [Rhizophagus irregularis DAOM 181602=DAOM 197198]
MWLGISHISENVDNSPSSYHFSFFTTWQTFLINWKLYDTRHLFENLDQFIIAILFPIFYYFLVVYRHPIIFVS